MPSILKSKSWSIYLNEKVSTTGIFCAATISLLLYLTSIRYHIYLPVHFFWVSIGMMFGSITYQILKIRLSTNFIKVVLLEIVILSFVFHLIYQIPYYGLRGSDAYYDLTSMKGILCSGFVRGDPQYTNPTSYWPMIHIIGSQVSLITNISAFEVAKWFPSLMGGALTILLYLLIRNVFKDEKVALLSTLLFSSLQHYILFGSLFIRESIALIFIVGCINLYFSARSLMKIALSIIFLICITFSHHLSSLILFIFILVSFVISKLLLFPDFPKWYYKNNLNGTQITEAVFLMAFIIPLSYWLYVYMQPLVTIITFYQGIVSSVDTATYAEISGIGISSIQTIRGYIIYIGFYFFHLTFGAFLLYQLLPNVKKPRLEIYSFTIFLFILGALGFSLLYFVPLKTAALYPDRLLAYGWLFGFAPLTVSILMGEHKWLKQIGIFLLVTFLFYNIYAIEPSAWNPHAEGVAAAPSEEDYAFANTFSFHEDIILGAHQNTLMAIYDVHNHVGKNIFGSRNTMDDIQGYDWIVVQKKVLKLENKYSNKPLTGMLYNLSELEQHPPTNMDKVYESNNLAAYKLKS